jgi:multidrug efflux pump subunit AcrB
MLLETPGVSDVITVSGFSIISGAAKMSVSALVPLDPWRSRASPDLGIEGLLAGCAPGNGGHSRSRYLCLQPSGHPRPGPTGGLRFSLAGPGQQTPQELAAVTQALVVAANQDPALQAVFSTYSADVPQLFLDLDRTKAESWGCRSARVFSTLQANLDRAMSTTSTFQPRLPGQGTGRPPFRNTVDDIEGFTCAAIRAQMVPISSLATVNGAGPPGGDALQPIHQCPDIRGEAAARRTVRASHGRHGAHRRPKPCRKDTPINGRVVVPGTADQRGQAPICCWPWRCYSATSFLVGKYESWSIPLPVITSISVATLGALVGIWLAGLDAERLCPDRHGAAGGAGQQKRHSDRRVRPDPARRGQSIIEAALTGARIRYRAVLMTAFSFILGVLPLVLATGAGANSRRAIGTTVFAGMLAATLVGIFLIPALYTAFQTVRERIHAYRQRQKQHASF